MARTTQPYRKGSGRQPSPILERMRAGRKLGAYGGKPLASAVKKAASRTTRTMPRY